MFNRIGVKTELEIIPTSAFFPLVTGPEGVSMFLFSWGSGAGETAILGSMFHTKKDAFGSWNVSHFSDSTVDAAIEDSYREIDTATRFKKMGAIAKDLMAKFIVIPIHDQPILVASKEKLVVAIDAIESTLAENIRPKSN